jgi:hypothetical protein
MDTKTNFGTITINGSRPEFTTGIKAVLKAGDNFIIVKK